MDHYPKILFVTDTLTSGGVESQLVELVTRLDRDKFEVMVVYFYGARAHYSEYFAPVLRQSGIVVQSLDLTLSAINKIKAVYEIMRIVRQYAPDIIHAENYHANLLTRIARPFLPFSVRLVGSIRGNYSEKQLLYERVSHIFCKVIVANGRHLRDQLIEKAGVPASKVHYIPNGVDSQRFAAVESSQEITEAFPSHTRLILTVGRIHPEKNIHWIAEAFGKLKTQNLLPDNIRLLVVGKSQDDYSQTLLDTAIEQYQLEDIVLCYGEVTRIEDLYAAAECTILFSPAEGLPNVVLESLAAGRPVVISEGANAASVIEDRVNGWVVRTGDTDHLAETLKHVFALSDAVRIQMSEACRLSAEQYSIERLVERFETLYSELDC